MTNPSNTYTWRVDHLIYNTVDTYEKVVTSAQWTLRVARGDSFVEHTGNAVIPQGDLTQSFTAFSDLSETQVMSWIMATFSVDSLTAIVAHCDRELERKLGSTAMLAGSLPWGPDTGVLDTPAPLMPEPPQIVLDNTVPQPEEESTATVDISVPDPTTIPLRPTQP